MDSGDVELLMVATLFDESPATDMPAEMLEVAPAGLERAEPSFMLLSATSEFVGEDVEKALPRMTGEKGEPVAEDFSGEVYVTAAAFGGEVYEGDVQALDEPVLMRFSATEAELATDIVAADDLVEADPSAEITVYAMMGPSPWQNVDNPDDVNADGWATPFDALLVINRVNEGLSLTGLATVDSTYYVDVNGDRCLDPSDAIQVINFLNGGGEESAVLDAASRVAPIWYDDRWTEDSAWQDPGWQDVDSAEWTDVTEGDASLAEPFAPLALPRLSQGDETADGDRLEEKEPQVEGDEGVFSEDADWLLADVI